MPSIPTILSIRFMLNPEWGVVNSADLPLTGARRPQLAQRPDWLALSMAMLVHIWKSLPFWTLILIAGRLAIPAEHYEAAERRRRHDVAEIPLHHLAVDAHALHHVA